MNAKGQQFLDVMEQASTENQSVSRNRTKAVESYLTQATGKNTTSAYKSIKSTQNNLNFLDTFPRMHLDRYAKVKMFHK